MLRSWLRRRFKRVPASLFLREHPDFSAFDIGKWTYGSPRVLSFGDPGLSIGRFCSIAEGVTILLNAEHRIDWVTTFPFMEFWESARMYGGHPIKKGKVTIGNDVWIGHGATILSGISIGDGAVIGACSVVTKDVEPYSIVAGNPARLLRRRFSPDWVSALQQIGWWNWSEEKITENLHLLLSGQVDVFIQTHRKN